MDFFNSFNGNCNGSSFITSSSSLVLDGEKSQLVRGLVKAGGPEEDKAEKALIALRNHSEAERRRRERINGHLMTLRSLIPGTSKLDKAALLAEAIKHVKELRVHAAEATKGFLVPMDTDEIRVEHQEDGSDGASYSIRASLCCDYKHELLCDLQQALGSIPLKTVRAEIATFGSRMINVFVISGHGLGNAEKSDGRQLLANSVRRALKSVLDKFYASKEFTSRNTPSSKRRRISLFCPSSSSSLGDLL